MKKRKKIILICIIITIIIITILPIPINKDECTGRELEEYKRKCNRTEIGESNAFGIPHPPGDCREQENEKQDKVIGLNGKLYQNSCYACRDCQQYFYRKTSILKFIINKLNN